MIESRPPSVTVHFCPLLPMYICRINDIDQNMNKASSGRHVSEGELSVMCAEVWRGQWRRYVRHARFDHKFDLIRFDSIWMPKMS